MSVRPVRVVFFFFGLGGHFGESDVIEVFGGVLHPLGVGGLEGP